MKRKYKIEGFNRRCDQENYKSTELCDSINVRIQWTFSKHDKKKGKRMIALQFFHKNFIFIKRPILLFPILKILSISVFDRKVSTRIVYMSV